MIDFLVLLASVCWWIHKTFPIITHKKIIQSYNLCIYLFVCLLIYLFIYSFTYNFYIWTFKIVNYIVGIQYIDKHHVNIITDYLCIIFDNNFHKFFCKGQWFWESKSTDFEKSKTSTVKDIDEHVVYKKQEYPAYLDWSGRLHIMHIDNKIVEIKN